MKHFIGALMAFTILAGAHAQTNWVICENPVNGARQSFPDSCPAGWIFVGL